MVFSIQKTLRQISTALLDQYLASKNASEFQTVRKLPRSKRLKPITERLAENDDDIARSILADLVRIHPLATERGRNALLNAAGGNEAFTEQFGRLENDFERALWTLMTHRDIFQNGEGLHFFDHHAEGSWGQHYRICPNLSVSNDEDDVREFRDEICSFYRHRDGSGVSCHVDFADRRREQGIQITIFVQGLPNNSTEFVNGRFRRTISHPAIEAAIVYETRTGAVTTVAKGGRAVHEVLRDAFAEHLLKIDPEYERVTDRRFRLETLKTGRVLLADPEMGIQSVFVRKLKLASPDFGGILVVEARGPETTFGVYDLGNRWFVEKSGLFEKFKVLQATISMRFQKRPDQRKTKTINLELSSTNGSNLKSLKEADRKIAEAHIEMWNLIEPAAVE